MHGNAQEMFEIAQVWKKEKYKDILQVFTNFTVFNYIVISIQARLIILTRVNKKVNRPQIMILNFRI